MALMNDIAPVRQNINSGIVLPFSVYVNKDTERQSNIHATLKP